MVWAVWRLLGLLLSRTLLMLVRWRWGCQHERCYCCYAHFCHCSVQAHEPCSSVWVPGADTASDQLALTELLFDAALAELAVVARGQPCINSGISMWGHQDPLLE